MDIMVKADTKVRQFPLLDDLNETCRELRRLVKKVPIKQVLVNGSHNQWGHGRSCFDFLFYNDDTPEDDELNDSFIEWARAQLCRVRELVLRLDEYGCARYAAFLDELLCGEGSAEMWASFTGKISIELDAFSDMEDVMAVLFPTGPETPTWCSFVKGIMIADRTLQTIPLALAAMDKFQNAERLGFECPIHMYNSEVDFSGPLALPPRLKFLSIDRSIYSREDIEDEELDDIPLSSFEEISLPVSSLLPPTLETFSGFISDEIVQRMPPLPSLKSLGVDGYLSQASFDLLQSKAPNLLSLTGSAFIVGEARMVRPFESFEWDFVSSQEDAMTQLREALFRFCK